MKITFEPSTPESLYTKFFVDTLTNYDTTDQLVVILLDAIRFAGHDQDNINNAAENYADSNRVKTYEE
jgi:hypothetical protein